MTLQNRQISLDGHIQETTTVGKLIFGEFEFGYKKSNKVENRMVGNLRERGLKIVLLLLLHC